MVYKKLQLVTPGRARKLGILTESSTPIFVSPEQEIEHICSECNTAYTALAYRVGYKTMAQHFHGRAGGIYSSPYQDNKRITMDNGFIAIMETTGQLIEEEHSFVAGFGRYRTVSEVQSEGVLVRGIRPFFKTEQISSLFQGLLMKDVEGFLYPRPYDLSEYIRGGSPISDTPLERYKYDYKATDDGEIIFIPQNRNLPTENTLPEPNKTLHRPTYHLF